jgi:hypothetical protein
MAEAELEEHIRLLALGLGLLRFHVRDSRGMTPGFPDDVLIGPGGILWRENKTARGKLRPDQRAVGRALRNLGHDWDVWRPADLISNRIARELTIIARTRK